MNIELQSKDPEPIKEQKIVVNGQDVGWVNESHEKVGSKYHAGLYVVPTQHYRGHLIQGHGDSIESAIEDALEGAIKKAKELVDGVADLREKILSCNHRDLN